MKTAFNSFIRNFKNRKVIYSITIGGLAVSLFILIFIFSFIIGEKSYNTSLANLHRLYRIKNTEGNTGVPKRSKSLILDKVPEVETLCLYNKSALLYEYNTQKHKDNFIETTPEFLELYNIKTIQGSVIGALESDDAVIITQDFAAKVFGSNDPIGQSIKLEGNVYRNVVAVIENPAKNNSLKYDALLKLNGEFFRSRYCNNETCYYMYHCILTLNKGVDYNAVNKKITSIMQQYYMHKNKEIVLQAYNDIYFDNSTPNDRHGHANSKLIELLGVIGLIIFILAILNFINLSTATNIERLKEVCIRKTSGAHNSTIIAQFLTESYIICGVAILLALLLIPIGTPIFNNILGKNFEILPVLANFKIMGLFVIGFLLIGFTAGLLPAIMVSKFNPVQLVSSELSSGKNNIRGLFNTAQFTVSIVLIICLIFVNKQITFVKTTNFGFNTEYLINFELDGRASNNEDAIIEKLLDNPNIISATASNGKPFEIWSTGSGSFKSDGEAIAVQNVSHIPVSQSFIKTFQIPLIMGRDFRATDQNVCIINKHFMKELNWDDIENKNIWAAKVIGVIDDIHFRSLHTKIDKLQLQYKTEDVSLHLISARINSNDLYSSINHISSVINEFEPGLKVKIEFYDEVINQLYQVENKQAELIRIFAIVAILLSCLGLFGMVEFAGKKRIKEIGIRKINGAKINEILMLLNKDFTLWIIVAFIVACPIAYLIMNSWLDSFAYKTALSWWVFALAGLTTILIAIATISWQTIALARRNPVEALRYE